MCTKIRFALLTCSLLALVAVNLSMVRAEPTWTGSVSNVWGNASNWNPAVVPTAGSDVRFGAASNTSVNLNGDRSVGLVTFDATVPFSLNNNNLTIATGVTTTNTPGGSHAINSDITLSAITTWNIATSALLNDTGLISGAGGITKSGTGTLTLSGNNTFAGGVTVNGGMLKVTAGTTPSSATQVASTGTLQLEGGVFAANGNVNVASGGTVNLITTGMLNGNGANGVNGPLFTGTTGGPGSPGRSFTTSGFLTLSGTGIQISLNGGRGGNGSLPDGNLQGAGRGGAGANAGTFTVSGGSSSLTGMSIMSQGQ